MDTSVMEGLLLRPDVVDIESLILLPDNPKSHSDEYIDALIEKYGFITRPIVNDITRHILGGNGRTGRLIVRKRSGKEPPKGIHCEDGKWYAGIDWTTITDLSQELPIAIALNRAEELGGWNQELLAKVLPKVPEDAVSTVGFEVELIKSLKAYEAEDDEDPEEWDKQVEQAVAKAAVKDGEPPRKELEVVRYILRTSTAKQLRKGLKEAMNEGDTQDLSDAFDIILNKYLEV